MFKRIPQGVRTFSTIEYLILRTLFFDHFLTPLLPSPLFSDTDMARAWAQAWAPGPGPDPGPDMGRAQMGLGPGPGPLPFGAKPSQKSVPKFLIKIKEMRDAMTINLPAVSRRHLCSEAQS